MAYQNVGTPRFYIDHGLWLSSIGEIATNHFIQLNPTNFIETDTEYIIIPRVAPITYIAYLGLYEGVLVYPQWSTVGAYMGDGDININGGTYESYLALGGEPNVPFGGGCLTTFSDNEDEAECWGIIGSGGYGAISIGSYYDMPNSPNLSLTMSREYGGVKEFTTHNGSSMSNTMWSSAPQWGNLSAWAIGDSNPALSANGRRSWDLTFSYMDDGDLWSSNAHLGTGDWGLQDSSLYGDDLYTEGDNTGLFLYDIITDDSFFSQVWHKTLGGTLPFIFQPDSSNSNPDQFAICRFKDNSLKATQSAFNVYDISLSIEEVW